MTPPWTLPTQPAPYRKRPVVVEAMRLERGAAGQVAVIDWIRSRGGSANSAPGKGVSIHTLEGVMLAEFGDFVIRGVQGEFYPCKADIFAATYDLDGPVLPKPTAAGRLVRDRSAAGEQPQQQLATELVALLNRHSAEVPSGTPDFVLAELLLTTLGAFNDAMRARAEWRGESLELSVEVSGA